MAQVSPRAREKVAAGTPRAPSHPFLRPCPQGLSAPLLGPGLSGFLVFCSRWVLAVTLALQL